MMATALMTMTMTMMMTLLMNKQMMKFSPPLCLNVNFVK